MVQENMLSRYPDSGLEALVHDSIKQQWYALASNGCLYGFTPAYGNSEAEGLQRLDADFYGCDHSVNKSGEKLFRTLFK